MVTWFDHHAMEGLLTCMGTNKECLTFSDLWEQSLGIHYVSSDSLKVTMYLVWPPTCECECWHYRCTPLCSGRTITLLWINYHVGGAFWKGVAPSEWVASTYGIEIVLSEVQNDLGRVRQWSSSSILSAPALHPYPLLLALPPLPYPLPLSTASSRRFLWVDKVWFLFVSAYAQLKQRLSYDFWNSVLCKRLRNSVYQRHLYFFHLLRVPNTKNGMETDGKLQSGSCPVL